MRGGRSDQACTSVHTPKGMVAFDYIRLRMAEYERQHYLPQFYLRGFTDPGKQGHVWAYRSFDPQWKLRGVGVTAQERYYYSFIDETGRHNHSIEKALQRIEMLIAPALKKLTETSDPLTTDERMAVARMVTFW